MDIDAIAKAMEVHFGECAVGKYCNLDDTSFAGGSVPTDPSNGQNKCAQAGNDFCGYCISSKNAQPGGDPNWANHGCGGVGGGTSSYWYNLVQLGSPGVVPGTSTQPSEYIVCANLETSFNGKYYYCIGSQQ